MSYNTLRYDVDDGLLCRLEGRPQCSDATCGVALPSRGAYIRLLMNMSHDALPRHAL